MYILLCHIAWYDTFDGFVPYVDSVRLFSFICFSHTHAHSVYRDAAFVLDYNLDQAVRVSQPLISQTC